MLERPAIEPDNAPPSPEATLEVAPAMISGGLPVRPLAPDDQPAAYVRECIDAWRAAMKGQTYSVEFTTLGAAEWNDESHDTGHELVRAGLSSKSLLLITELSGVQTISLHALRESLDDYPGVGQWNLGMSVHQACVEAVQGVCVYGPVQAYNLGSPDIAEEMDLEVLDQYLDHLQSNAQAQAVQDAVGAGRDPEQVPEVPRLAVGDIERGPLFAYLEANGLRIDALKRAQMRLPPGTGYVECSVKVAQLKAALRRGAARGMPAGERRALGVLVSELGVLETLGAQFRALCDHDVVNTLLAHYKPSAELPTIILDVTSVAELSRKDVHVLGTVQEEVVEHEDMLMQVGEPYGRAVVLSLTPQTAAAGVKAIALLQTIEQRALAVFNWAEAWPPTTARPDVGAARATVAPMPEVPTAAETPTDGALA